MATLVLTVVGGAIGGPVGAAVGGLIGQGIDARLLAPRRREGPRLTELAVQTSSYGTQIPKLFGTMRVAGTVIWATDLRETRHSGSAGKGQPKVNSYSYSASFAVALSARPILAVRRVWADGKLVRGAAGDWKVHTGFRVHGGDEAQPVDPLIASAEGRAPAHRGTAYAVFEGLELADFGNRIPSLTFEVVADAEPMRVSDVAKALAGEIEGHCALALDGFAASGGSVRAVLETLGNASGAWFGADGAVLRMRDAPGSTTEVEDAGFAVDGRSVKRGRRVAAADTTPRVVTVAHYDPARDYQTGVQRAARPGTGGRDERVEVPAVIAAGVAKGIAESALARGEAGRVRRQVAGGFAAMTLSPGDAVSVRGEAGVWRIVSTTLEGMVVRLELTPVTLASPPARADAGRVLPQLDAPVGRTLIEAFETPVLDDAPPAGPRLTIAAAGEGAGWRRAGLLYSLDDGASWIEAGATAPPAVIGRVVEAPPRAPSAVIDLDGALVVELAHEGMTLGDADDRRLDAGANLAVIGDELVQFGRAERLAASSGVGRWRLSRLLRGRRGTETARVPEAGDRFVLVEADLCRVLDLPAGAVGAEVRVLASGVGDIEGPAAASVRLSGASLLPPSPVHPRAHVSGDGSASVTWVRRSRVGWRWIDGVDAGLGEEAEGYRATIARADGTVREAMPDAPLLAIEPAELAAGPVSVAVRMRGTHGDSAPAAITVGGTER